MTAGASESGGVGRCCRARCSDPPSSTGKSSGPGGASFVGSTVSAWLMSTVDTRCHFGSRPKPARGGPIPPTFKREEIAGIRCALSCAGPWFPVLASAVQLDHPEDVPGVPGMHLRMDLPATAAPDADDRHILEDMVVFVAAAEYQTIVWMQAVAQGSRVCAAGWLDVSQVGIGAVDDERASIS